MPKINEYIKPAKKISPQCYAFTTPTETSHDGYVKIGYTDQEDVRTRIEQEVKTAAIPYNLEWARRAVFISPPYDSFKDHDFFAYLRKVGVVRMSPPPGQKKAPEWFFVDPNEALNYFKDFIDNHGVLPGNAELIMLYTLRDEQEEAVEKTKEYFDTHTRGEFLWNAKPRFGKTLATYDLCKQMGFGNILIVTNRPAIAASWYDDYEKFFGTESGWLFVSTCDSVKGKKHVLTYEEYQQKVTECKDDSIKGMIRFVSLQDLKGSKYFGGQFDKLIECSDYVNPLTGNNEGYYWDCLVIDEAHEGVDTYKTDVAFDHIRRKNTLHLSGTPFKALASEKFPSDAIYNWTYADEQTAKANWDESSEEENPYLPLPKLNLFTYQMTDFTKKIIQDGIDNGDENAALNFTLGEFFSTWSDADAPKEEWIGKFKHEAEVDRFLDALVTGEKFPFSTSELRNELKHTFWFLDRIDSAKALAEKLKIHPVFREYQVIQAVGTENLDEGLAADNALGRVKEAIKKSDKTITLSVGQLTTGVTIPEWTAVFMLCGKQSEAVYMQAAFRAQNPCMFKDTNGDYYRKENAYIFDFDPARVLRLFDKFANNLNSDTAGGKGDLKTRTQNIRELLNFFPVFAEDDLGEMVALDAETVLTIPQHYDAQKVVKGKFMTNELFDNISNIFSAPQFVRDIVNKMNAPEYPSEPMNVDSNTKNELCINDKGEIEIPEETIIGRQAGIFGEKVYGEVTASIEKAVKKAEKSPEKDSVETLMATLGKAYTDRIVANGKEGYGKAIDQKIVDKVSEIPDRIIHEAHKDYSFKKNMIEQEMQERQANASTGAEQTAIRKEYEEKLDGLYSDTTSAIVSALNSEDTINKGERILVSEQEKKIRQDRKEAIENEMREHLKGFTRTIPSFLMAFGNENTTLATFEQNIPEDVFIDVTSITIDEFKALRDGCDCIDENGNSQHFAGHCFNEIVFNEAVQIFLKLKKDLANYFDPEQTEDIFNYIPPQKTNQIFTPKKVVIEMTDMLTRENPGCFDDPNATFADLYMKSGMYVTEIVKRLYNSSAMKSKFPDSADRLRHIFEKQVYGCAPTGILYGITRAYILGFADEIDIPVDHIVQVDTLEYAQDGTLQEELEKRFPELN